MRLDFIRRLYERPGPYASVYLGAFTGPERRAHWRGARDRLDRLAEKTLDALEEEALRPAAGRALFATDGDVVLAESLDRQPGEMTTWTPLPHVTPMLMLRGENVPHIRVIVDHAGAEVTVFAGGSPRTTTVEAASWPLQKTAQEAGRRSATSRPWTRPGRRTRSPWPMRSTSRYAASGLSWC